MQCFGYEFAVAAVELLSPLRILHSLHILWLFMFYLKDHKEKISWMTAATETMFNTVFKVRPNTLKTWYQIS